jgi:hypothetical protein
VKKYFFYSTYAFQYGDCFLGEPDGIEDIVVEDGLEEVVLVVGLERRLPGHHFVHQHAQSPPVDTRAVIQLLKNLKKTG